MNQTYINELKNHIGEAVTLKGWLYNSHSSDRMFSCDKISVNEVKKFGLRVIEPNE